MSPAVRAWLDAFLFTQAIEVPIYVAVQARQRVGSRAEWWGAAFSASAVTHPMVWFVIPQLPLFRAPALQSTAFLGFSSAYLLQIVISETFAIVVEALLFYVLRVRKALLWAFVANATSSILGLILRELVGWP